MIYVIDLFCGCGGFSEGAKQAGANVILAIDNWGGALDVHRRNHPGTEHWKIELGGDINDIVGKISELVKEKVPPGGRIHIHASPPCQNLSTVNTHRDPSKGLVMLDWTLSLINTLGPSTWSLENVSHPTLRSYPNAHVFNMEEYGVPQTRRRIVMCGGFDPDIVEKSEITSSISALSKSAMDIEWMNYNTVCSGSYKRYFRCVTKPCYTILTNNQVLRHKESLEYMVLTHVETALFQTFPTSYTVKNLQMIANAVPPEFARRLVSAVISSV